MQTLTLTRETQDAQVTVARSLRDAGFGLHDGWFYPPAGPLHSLVRIEIYGGQYQLFRRRTLTSPWTRIAVYDVEDFDPEAFKAWVTVWPLADMGAG